MWKEEYVKIAFPHNSADLQIEKAQALKYQNIPPALYRYRNFTPYNIENLKNGVEWQSYPSEFNDPFDARLTITADSLKKDWFQRKLDVFIEALRQTGVEFSSKEVEQIRSSENPMVMFSRIVLAQDPQLVGQMEVINEMATFLDSAVGLEMEQITDKFRDAFSNGYLIVCFSEEKDNVLMWSHYAENHTGYCIEYDFKALGPNHPRVRMLQPVIYTDDFFDATEYYKNAISGSQDFNNLYGIYPTISKSTQWAYEKEWRTIFPWGPGVAKNDKEMRSLPMPTPKRLLLGAKISEENKQIILDIAKEKKIPVYQMTLDKNGFKLGEESVYIPE